RFWTRRSGHRVGGLHTCRGRQAAHRAAENANPLARSIGAAPGHPRRSGRALMARVDWERAAMLREFGDRRAEADRRQRAERRAIERERERRKAERRKASLEAIERERAAAIDSAVTDWQARFTAAG